MVTFHMKDKLSDDGTSKIDIPVRMYDNVKTTGRCVVLPASVAAGHSRGLAQACGAG